MITKIQKCFKVEAEKLNECEWMTRSAIGAAKIASNEATNFANSAPAPLAPVTIRDAGTLKAALIAKMETDDVVLWINPPADQSQGTADYLA